MSGPPTDLPGASRPSPAARVVGGLISIYQKTVSPALAVANPFGGCRFAPTCSHYAADALREHGLLAGAALTARRVIKCGPWHPGGLDPVPPRMTPAGFRAEPRA